MCQRGLAAGGTRVHCGDVDISENDYAYESTNVNPRPAGPSPTPALCWGRGSGPIYLGNQ